MSKIFSGQFNLNFLDGFSFCEVITGEYSNDRIFLCLEKDEDKNGDGKEIFSKIKNIIKENFFDDRNFDREIAFEGAVKKINEQKFIENGKINIIIGLYSNEFLFITQTGQSETYLLRNDQITVVCEQDKENNPEKDLFTDIIVPKSSLVSGDIVIFSTKRILSALSPNQIISGFKKGLSLGMENIKETLHSKEFSCAGIILNSVKSNLIRNQKQKTYSINDYVDLKKISEKSREFFYLGKDKMEDLIYLISKKTSYSYESVYKSVIAFFGGLVFFILIAMIAFSSKNSSQIRKTEEIKQKLDKIDISIDLASKYSLTSPNQAEDIIKAIKEDIKDISNEGVLRDEILKKIDKMKKIEDEVYKITRIKDPMLLVNLSGNSENILGFEELNGVYYAYDENKFYRIILDKLEKEIPFVSGEKIKLVLTGDESRKRIFVFSQKNVLYEFDGDNFTKITTNDSFGWKNNIDVGTYSKYFYLLDNGSSSGSGSYGQIWKYSRGGNGFSASSPYSKNPISFSDGLSITIDGGVYVLSKGGNISSFYAGDNQNFSYEFNKEIIKNATKIYTNKNIGNLYLLDKEENKIISLTKIESKGAKLGRQYVISEDEKLKDFIIGKDESNIVFLAGNKIFKFPLK